MIVKRSSKNKNGFSVKMSKTDWLAIGKQAGWFKSAQLQIENEESEVENFNKQDYFNSKFIGHFGNDEENIKKILKKIEYIFMSDVCSKLDLFLNRVQVKMSNGLVIGDKLDGRSEKNISLWINSLKTKIEQDFLNFVETTYNDVINKINEEIGLNI